MKKIVIMRGVSGSGKSTLAKQIAGDNGVICSADNFFVKAGSYEFDAKRLPAAHAECKRLAREAMQADVSLVVVDNTNTQLWEFRPYLDMAAEFNYAIEIRIPETPWAWDAEECARKNSHGVPLETIKKMIARFQK